MQFGKEIRREFFEKRQADRTVVYGGVGTGKTFATACIANYLMERGKTVLVNESGTIF